MTGQGDKGERNGTRDGGQGTGNFGRARLLPSRNYRQIVRSASR